MARRNVEGTWELVQSSGHHVRNTIWLDHGNGVLTGEAHEADKFGTLNGDVTDAECHFRVQWNHGPVGNYTGWFDSIGHLRGITYDEKHPSVQATWVVPGKAFTRIP